MKTKGELLRDISNHKQSMWFWIIIAILFCWTGIGLVVGLLGAFICHEMKTDKEIKLVELK